MKTEEERRLKDQWGILIEAGAQAEKRVRALARAPGLLRLAKSGPDPAVRRFVRSLAHAEIQRKARFRAVRHVANILETIKVGGEVKIR